MLAPALILYVGLLVVPLVQTFQLSAFRFSGVSTKRTFVGFENYQRLWLDEAFWWSLRNSLTLLFTVGPIVLVLSLFLAHATTATGRTAKAVRSVILFPNILSVVVVAMVWRGVYNPSTGLLKGLGIVGPQNGWLGDLNTAFPAFCVAYLWASVGFYTMLFSAGIQNIDREVVEAAELDGATPWRKFAELTWPLLWSVRRVATTHLAISLLSVFAFVNVMTDGAPSERTQVLLNFLYRQMTTEGDYGGATAVGVVNFCLMLTVALAVALAFRKNPVASRRPK